MSYLERVRQEFGPKTPREGTDKTDKRAFVSSVSTPSERFSGNPAPRHEPMVDALIRDACAGLTVTPQQFRALCSPADIEDIRSGGLPPAALRVLAESYSEGIRSGRIAFHPMTGRLEKHGLPGRAA